MTYDEAPKRRGLSLRLVIILMFAIGVVVSATLAAVTFHLTDQYTDTEQATQDYLNWQNDVNTIRDAIHDLNEWARNFVVTGNQEELIRYFNEVQVQRSIQAAMDGFENEQLDSKTLRHLETAIALNDQMAATQIYAMRLAMAGYGYNLTKAPVPIQAQSLTEEDMALEPDQQVDRALELLFSKDYTLLKGQVDNRIELCKDALEALMNDRHLSSSNEMRRVLRDQRLLVYGQVVAMLVVMLFVLILVVYPIQRMVQAIRSTHEVSPGGSSELRFLSETYNQMYRQMESVNTKLSYEASHDALTGLYNRSAYEAIRDQIGNRDIALLLVDVDLFKGINDSYGHDIGDKVLVRVARVLQDSFREADRVCRIGGDEFAVIMMGVTSSVVEVIRRKIAAASQLLGTPEDEIPSVTISVGCAFSEQLAEGENLFKNADRALYWVKQDGRNNCGFYHLRNDDDKTFPTPKSALEA